MVSTKNVYKGKDEGAKEKQCVQKNDLYFTSEQKIYFYVCLQNIRINLFELEKQPKFILSVFPVCNFIE